jgi:hypothetical protein
MVFTSVAPRLPQQTPSTLAPEPLGLARCPSCHTQDGLVTNLAVSAGADWQCARCGSRWNAARVATVAAYAAWVSEHTAAPVNPAPPAAGGV